MLARLTERSVSERAEGVNGMCERHAQCMTGEGMKDSEEEKREEKRAACINETNATKGDESGHRDASVGKEKGEQSRIDGGDARLGDRRIKA